MTRTLVSPEPAAPLRQYIETGDNRAVFTLPEQSPER